MSESGSTPPIRPISVLLIDDEKTWVRTQRRLLERSTGEIGVSTATSFAAATDALRGETPDCIVCDHQLGDGTGLDLLAEVRAENPEVPFILVTGEGDEAVASDAIGQRVTDYIPKLHLSRQPTRLARRIVSVVTADRTRRALARERRHKEALLDIVTASSTRSELGGNVCEQLVDDGYACAWIAVLDDDRGIVPLSTAGDTDYLEAAIAPGTRPADCTEPTFRALLETEPVFDSLPPDERNEIEPADWTQIAVDHGVRSVAALPISHHGVYFGVLTVYGRTPQIGDRERALLGEYAETVGYVFQTTAWKRTLLSSAAATVEFTLTDECHPLLALAAALPAGSTLRTATVIPRNDDHVLYVTTAEGVTEADLSEAVDATDAVVSVDCYRTDDGVHCGIVAESPVPETRLVDAGVSLSETVVVGGRARLSAVLGGEATVQQCVDALSELCDEGSVTTLWTTDESATSETEAIEALTDRQRQVLELAVEAGYFERPRHNNTGELADALDISRATFTQHLRAAQRKLFAAEIHR
ncbi:bacterio-opsin activator domain-containing protein [Halorubrum lipolyticum]|uniref:Response regulator receiver protein n=1 Tax=Halorubrum lipolyticum DSM 21995 TaxID=1227482 RepID=M0NQG7_9EURY|nr:helix-turn-helix domain-containing protein [Halorubrum lipolyticum]EMA59863.1 response regulator receiver protein [Halorubrum lipolyticum DSM 21995]